VESLKTQVATVKTDCLPKDLWDNANKQIKHALEEISKDMALKSNIKDVCKLLDLKANTKYVDGVLST